MEAQADSSAAELNRQKDFQKLLKSSSSASLTTDVSHNAAGEHVGTPGHHCSQVLTAERRQPLSSVSSLEVHFDLLDLTELTDMSDQELGEVFADSDEENHNELPANHQPPLPRFPHGGYVRSPSWTRGCKGEQQPRDRKHHSDSENTEPLLKIERSQSQQP
ncbi:dysbindin domain-containing protein 1 [Tachysurus fulvidraco]|uniref:dysbindin domain-containing protein 1 n=1 Tax=Tachysurus fulvidraco TaxID=1234273 RepID=UPI000F4DE868|nr:dysbindin domain-containing protein 1 [Tachysurus fulvidraco]